MPCPYRALHEVRKGKEMNSLADAIAQLTNGKACKRPNWAGYVKRVDGQDGAYSIVFVKRDGTQNTYAVAANGTITTSSAVSMDPDLFAAMCSTDWIIGDTASFEQGRTSTGTW